MLMLLHIVVHMQVSSLLNARNEQRIGEIDMHGFCYISLAFSTFGFTLLLLHVFTKPSLSLSGRSCHIVQ